MYECPMSLGGLQDYLRCVKELESGWPGLHGTTLQANLRRVRLVNRERFTRGLFDTHTSPEGYGATQCVPPSLSCTSAADHKNDPTWAGHMPHFAANVFLSRPRRLEAQFGRRCGACTRSRRPPTPLRRSMTGTSGARRRVKRDAWRRSPDGAHLADMAARTRRRSASVASDCPSASVRAAPNLVSATSMSITPGAAVVCVGATPRGPISWALGSATE